MSGSAADGAIVQLRIDAIGSGGAGVGRDPDGRVVFVQRTAPGDLVRLEITDARKRWARGRLREVLEAGPGRREPPCPLFERCGGCTLEHLQYPAQLEAKRRLVRDALARIGGVTLPGDIAITGSPVEFQYRNRVSFTLRRLGARVVAGFHELDRPAHVLDVDERCLLPEPALATAWGALRRAWGERAERLPRGGNLRLTLRTTGAGQVSLLIDGGVGRGAPDALLAAVPGLAAIWHRGDGAPAATLLAGEAEVAEVWAGENVGLSGALFLQVNRSAATLLEAHVLALAGNLQGATVIDAYCGVGLHARRLARGGARVIGLELDAHAVAQARLHAPAGAEFREGRVELLLESALPADLCILNPPRAGVDGHALDTLLARPPQRLIYVSCDPATLARDLARLGTAYRLRTVQCFDLFPQTSHVETVVELACCIT